MSEKREICLPTGKIIYQTSAEAHNALKSILKRKTNKYSINTVYRCPDCLGFHLTKQEK